MAILVFIQKMDFFIFFFYFYNGQKISLEAAPKVWIDFLCVYTLHFRGYMQLFPTQNCNVLLC